MNLNWTVRLGEVATIERNSITADEIQDGTRYVGLEHISAGGERLDHAEVAAGDLASNKFRFEQGHVLYGKLRPYLAKIVAPDFAGVCSTDILPIRPSPAIDKHFLLHYLRLPENVAWAAGRATGVNLPRLSPSELAELTIPLPPLDEQRRIAAILVKADELRQKRKRAIALLDSLTQSIFLEMFGDITVNPRQFPMGTLSDVCSFKGGAQPPKSVFTDAPGPDKIRLIQIRDYKSDRYVTYIPRAVAKRFCTASDVMIGRYGPPVFQILRGLEGSYNVALMKAEPKKGYNKEFLFWLLASEKVQQDVIGQSARTAGQSGVNLDYLNSYPVYLPPLSLQIEFEGRMSEVLAATSNARISAEYSDYLFASLQHRAFSGQL